MSDPLNSGPSITCQLEYAAACANRYPNSCLDCSSRFFVFGAGRYVAIYDREKGTIATLLLAHKDLVSSVRLIYPLIEGPHEISSRYILSGSHDHTCIVWSATGQPEKGQFDFTPKFTLAEHTDIISAAHSVITTNALNNIILSVTASLDGTLKLWIDQTCRVSDRIKYYVYDLKISSLYCDALKKDIVFVFLGASDDTIHVYKIDLDKELPLVEVTQIAGHSDWVRSIDILHSADRSKMLLASASQDKLARVWRISLAYATYTSLLVKSSRLPDVTEQPIYLTTLLETVLAGHESRIYSVRWNRSRKKVAHATHPDHVQLMTCSSDKTIIVWGSDLVTHSDPMDIDEQNTNPDKPPPCYERNLTSDVWQERLRLGDIGEGNLGFLGASIAPDSNCIVAYSLNGALHAWSRHSKESCDSSESWKPEPIIGGHFGPVTDICWQRDGAYFMTSSLDKSCRLHAFATIAKRWCEFARPQVHGYEINCITLSNSLRLISGADEKNIRVFDATKFLAKSLRDLASIDLMKSSDCALLASMVPDLSEQAQAPALGLSNRGVDKSTEKLESGQDEAIPQEVAIPVEELLLQGTLWPEVQKLYGHSYEIFSIDCDSKGEHIASASKANKSEFACIIIWCAKTFNQIISLENHTLTVTRIRFSPDSKYLLSVSRDRTWCLRSNDRGTEFLKLAATDKSNAIHSRIIWDCAWTPNSKCFVTVSRERKAIAWSCERVVIESASNVYTAPESNCLILPTSIQAVDITNSSSGNQNWFVALGQENGDVTLARLSFTYESFEWTIAMNIKQCHSLSIRRLSFRPSTSELDCMRALLATTSEDNLVKLISIYNSEIKE